MLRAFFTPEGVRLSPSSLSNEMVPLDELIKFLYVQTGASESSSPITISSRIGGNDCALIADNKHSSCGKVGCAPFSFALLTMGEIKRQLLGILPKRRTACRNR